MSSRQTQAGCGFSRRARGVIQFSYQGSEIDVHGLLLNWFYLPCSCVKRNVSSYHSSPFGNPNLPVSRFPSPVGRLRGICLPALATIMSPAVIVTVRSKMSFVDGTECGMDLVPSVDPR